MGQYYHLSDGYRDPVTDEPLGYNNDLGPRAVTITPKSPGSTFTIPERWLVEYSDLLGNPQYFISAVDYGTQDGFYTAGNIPSSATSGDRVIIYFNLGNVGNEGATNGVSILVDTWSSFLSQIETLHNALPGTLNYNSGESYINIVIDSPKFTAPEGIWNAGSQSSDPIFFGSTFTVGPKIWGDDFLDVTPTWPPSGRSTSYDPWTPFRNMDLRLIENQGTLGERCEMILASNLVYIDEDGYERVDAYPSGGVPRVLDHAVGPVNTFQMDSGSKFPVYDLSELVVAIRPFDCKTVILPTRSAPVSLPVGADVKEASKLKRYTNGIGNVISGMDEQGYETEVPLVFGLKTLGIDFQEGVEYLVNSHMLYRQQAQLNEGDDFKVGFWATTKMIKQSVNFSLGIALQEHFGIDEDTPVAIPGVPSTTIYLNRYCEVEESMAPNLNGYAPWYWVTVKADSSITGIEIPRINAPNLKWLDGYCENTFMSGRTGHVEFTIPSGATYSGTVKHHVPAPPHHEGIIIRNHRKNMAAYVSGAPISFPTTSPPGAMQLVYGRVTETDRSPNPVAVFNVDGDWFNDNLQDGSIGPNPQLKEFKEMIDPVNFATLKEMAEGQTEREAEYTLSISYNGFDLETFDTSGIEYAISWEEGVFYNAQVNPESIPNILTPINPEKIKGVDGAYRLALHVATPLSSTVRYLDSYNLDEPSKTVVGGSYTPSYTMIIGFGVPEWLSSQYVYELDQIDIPDFKLGDDDRSVMNSWGNVFSRLIWGDMDGFKTAHGIPPMTDLGGSTSEPVVASSETLGTGVLNWKQRQVGTNTYQALIPPSIMPLGLGQRGFGVRLFRDEIPWYRDDAPLYGDPIFIGWDSVNDNWIWDGNDINLLRNSVAPVTTPI